MKAYNFETLLNYVFKRLSFSSRVRVMGHWDWYADDIPPGSRMRVTFYLERNVHTMDLETYEKFLAGELDYFDENLKNTGITLYDAFHRKRLKAAFMKK